MKLLILALGFLSLPAFAEVSNEASSNVANQEADAWVCLGNRNFGVCFGNRGPGYGQPGYGYGPGYGQRGAMCVAQNARGFRFRGFGRWIREAQNDALDNCYRAGSRFCRVIGCR
jgi:hypothetical protein